MVFIREQCRVSQALPISKCILLPVIAPFQSSYSTRAYGQVQERQPSRRVSGFGVGSMELVVQQYPVQIVCQGGQKLIGSTRCLSGRWHHSSYQKRCGCFCLLVGIVAFHERMSARRLYPVRWAGEF
jgi:hypothetical protein